VAHPRLRQETCVFQSEAVAFIKAERGEKKMVLNKHKLLGLGCLVALGAFSTRANAQMGPPHGEGGGELGPLKMLLRNANLTEDQQTQVHQLMQSQRSQVQPIEKQIRALREQMADKLLSVGTVTAADFASMQQQMAQLRSQLADQTLKTALKIRALLSNDQLNRMNQVSQRLQAIHREMETIMNPEGAPELGPGGP
jgi:Spy/CpxP family protein refolding chaperone